MLFNEHWRAHSTFTISKNERCKDAYMGSIYLEGLTELSTIRNLFPLPGQHLLAPMHCAVREILIFPRVGQR